jgi:di/tricarboxylate transporter
MPAKQQKLTEDFGLEELSEAEADELSISSDAGLAEILLPPRSKLIGETLRSVGFREVYGISVLGALRLGKAVPHPIADLRLKFGDTLLVQGPWERVRSLRRQQRDFVVTGEARGEAETMHLTVHGWIALGVMATMMALMTLGLLPTVTVILGAGLAMILTRCVSMEAAYRSMSWESLVVIAAMLPMAEALEKTGGIELAAAWLTETLGGIGPLAVIAGLFAVTSLFSQFVSNTATAVLVAPIAFRAAVEMGVSERAFLMTVAVAASTAFATPVASPTNTLVLTPGGYRFGDYTRVGVPLQLLILVATMLLIPVLFPL